MYKNSKSYFKYIRICGFKFVFGVHDQTRNKNTLNRSPVSLYLFIYK